MIGKFDSFFPWLQAMTIDHLPITAKNSFQYILPTAVGILLLILFLILTGIAIGIRKWSWRRILRREFGITDISRLCVRIMGRHGSRYYTDSASNCYEITLPHWKFANEDGSRQNRRVNKVVWEECSLWLHDGHKTYVLTTTDPYDMIYLVHTLRERGIDIAPCAQELEKQESIEAAKQNSEEVLREVLEKCEGNEEKFSAICRQRLTIRGYTLTDAPRNNDGLKFFFLKDAQPVMVRCHLVPRDYLVDLDEMRKAKEGTTALFAPHCLFITTGQVSVAAAGYALANGIDMVLNDRLVEILEEDKHVPADKAFTRWEFTNDDLRGLLSEDLLSKIF